MPTLPACASLRAVTHSSEECNLCVCLLTQALCSEPQEGHVPPPSQFQFLIKVNTVWKCSHTLARSDGSRFEFFSLPTDQRGSHRAQPPLFLCARCVGGKRGSLHGSGCSTHWRRRHEMLMRVIKHHRHNVNDGKNTHIKAHVFTWLELRNKGGKSHHSADVSKVQKCSPNFDLYWNSCCVEEPRRVKIAFCKYGAVCASN